MPRPPKKTAPLTVTVAVATATDFGYCSITKAAELVRCRPARGKTLSLPAAKAFNLMLSVAGHGGFEDRLYSIPKRDLRGTHNANDRIPDILDELHTTLFEFTVESPRGKPAKLVTSVLAARIEELADTDDALVYFRLPPELVKLHRLSTLWSKLSGPTLIRFDSAYALRLYEIGCQMVGRDEPTMRITPKELRDLLHVPASAYRDWTSLRRKTLDAAIVEVNQLADFVINVPPEEIRRSGRKVISILLQFWAKPGTEAEAARKERLGHSAGRRARRQGKVETVTSEGA